MNISPKGPKAGQDPPLCRRGHDTNQDFDLTFCPGPHHARALRVMDSLAPLPSCQPQGRAKLGSYRENHVFLTFRLMIQGTLHVFKNSTSPVLFTTRSIQAFPANSHLSLKKPALTWVLMCSQRKGAGPRSLVKSWFGLSVLGRRRSLYFFHLALSVICGHKDCLTGPGLFLKAAHPHSHQGKIIYCSLQGPSNFCLPRLTFSGTKAGPGPRRCPSLP